VDGLDGSFIIYGMISVLGFGRILIAGDWLLSVGNLLLFDLNLPDVLVENIVVDVSSLGRCLLSLSSWVSPWQVCHLHEPPLPLLLTDELLFLPDLLLNLQGWSHHLSVELGGLLW